MTVICGVAVILVSAEDVSERAICGAAVILAFAEEVSVRVICGVVVYWCLQRICLRE